MRASRLFWKTRKEAPRDEVAKNAELLIRAGYIDKVMAGVYTLLPLGLRTLKKIEAIIREEMNQSGGQELYMPSLQPKDNWLITGRWNSEGMDLYTTKDASDREYALGPTHEEIVTPLVGQHINSYKDLPLAVYQFQNKFRAELRAKSGLLRGREFIMKDLYSFHRDEADLGAFYSKMKDAYKTIFERVGIGDRTYLTFASGGTFSKYSHEFQTLTPAGEDTIHICDTCRVAVNEEVLGDVGSACPECGAQELRKEKAIEVGNIFENKTKYTAPFEVNYKDEAGALRPVLMGCYGIGLQRLMGTIVEVLADDKGLVWPKAVAPFDVTIVEMPSKNEAVREKASRIAAELEAAGFDVFHDDRETSAGAKFTDAELIGIPYQVVIGERLAAEKDSVELRDRSAGTASEVPVAEVVRVLRGY